MLTEDVSNEIQRHATVQPHGQDIRENNLAGWLIGDCTDSGSHHHVSTSVVDAYGKEASRAGHGFESHLLMPMAEAALLDSVLCTKISHTLATAQVALTNLTEFVVLSTYILTL